VITFAILSWGLATEPPAIAAGEDIPPLSAFLDHLDYSAEVQESEDKAIAIPADIPRCTQNNLIYWLTLSPKTAHFIAHRPDHSRDPPG
jgi:hypothetical protein